MGFYFSITNIFYMTWKFVSGLVSALPKIDENGRGPYFRLILRDRGLKICMGFYFSITNIFYMTWKFVSSLDSAVPSCGRPSRGWQVAGARVVGAKLRAPSCGRRVAGAELRAPELRASKLYLKIILNKLNCRTVKSPKRVIFIPKTYADTRALHWLVLEARHSQ